MSHPVITCTEWWGEGNSGLLSQPYCTGGTDGRLRLVCPALHYQAQSAATGNGSGCTILKADYLAKEAGILSHNDTPIGNHRCDDHEGVRLSNMVRWRASSSWPEGWFYFI